MWRSRPWSLFPLNHCAVTKLGSTGGLFTYVAGELLSFPPTPEMLKTSLSRLRGNRQGEFDHVGKPSAGSPWPPNGSLAALHGVRKDDHRILGFWTPLQRAL